MLRVAVTVSKKSNIFPSTPQLFLDPVDTVTLVLVEEDKKTNKTSFEYPLKNQDCCPAPIAQKRTVKASRWIL